MGLSRLVEVTAIDGYVIVESCRMGRMQDLPTNHRGRDDEDGDEKRSKNVHRLHLYLSEERSRIDGNRQWSADGHLKFKDH